MFAYCRISMTTSATMVSAANHSNSKKLKFISHIKYTVYHLLVQSVRILWKMNRFCATKADSARTNDGKETKKKALWARAKAIYMFIIVGVHCNVPVSCDVSYSESFNWNSYFNYYVIHDFMKFELVHFVCAELFVFLLKKRPHRHSQNIQRNAS